MALSLNRVSAIGFLILIASLSGLAVAVARKIQSAPMPVDDERAELVLRHMIKTAEPALIKPASALCISTNQADASPALLARLRDIKPIVVPKSHCHWDIDSGQALDNQTGKPVTFFFIDNQICHRWRTRCSVNAGYAIGNLGGQGGRYRVERSGGRWRVTGMDERWIS